VNVNGVCSASAGAHRASHLIINHIALRQRIANYYYQLKHRAFSMITRQHVAIFVLRSANPSYNNGAKYILNKIRTEQL